MATLVPVGRVTPCAPWQYCKWDGEQKAARPVSRWVKILINCYV